MWNFARSWIKIKSLFFINPEKRRLYRQRQYKARTERLLASARWGVSYSVFDGEELLESSIKAIRGEVDYINIIYQLKSWYGQPADAGLLPLVRSLKDRGLVDEIIEFEPDLSLKAPENERRKRQTGLAAAAAAGCNYYMAMDCDEFYVAAEIAGAKREIITRELSHSYCVIVMYGPNPTQLIQRPYTLFVPFFARINQRSRLGGAEKAPCLVDASRNVDGGPGARRRVIGQAVMHHMWLVRRNPSHKFLNSSAFNHMTPAERTAVFTDDFFDEKRYLPVKNIFNIKV
ncbi:hypothetical protein LJB86_01715 [Deltaproteobacteria bacterium OttesenSCG-928-M10]|nr:hypothetical protein [Deltaproteobacteria bacterium OttesenSCG-928-M10]